MNRFRLIILVAVLALAIRFLIVGAFYTSHKRYSRFGEASASYEGADPVLIREYSFT